MATPPKLWLRFFRWFCRPELQKYIEGDLTELYISNSEEMGERKAACRFIIDVLLLFRPGIVRPVKIFSTLSPPAMIKNYLTIGFRNMLSNKVFSFINIFGLALGMATSLIIFLYVSDEVNFDRFNADADRIYRIGFAGRMQDNDFKTALSAAPTAPAMLQEIPEVESIVRFGLWTGVDVKYQDKVFIEDHLLVTDSNFFSFFSFKLTEGNPKTALKGLNKVVLTKSAVKKYFGDENPMGKIILRGSWQQPCEVTGVMNDPPANSHIQFTLLVSGDSWNYFNDDKWTSSNIYSYIKINPNADPASVQEKLNVLTEKHMGQELQDIMKLSFAQFRSQGNSLAFFLQPFTSIHTGAGLTDEITPTTNVQYLYILSAIGVFILVIACINFMSLSTARSANRAKEVGVRKSIGAISGKLIAQFITESMTYSVIAVLLAIVIIIAFINPFNALTGKTLTLSFLTDPLVLADILLFTVITGLLAGSYPAFYLASFKPVDVLKGKVREGFRNSAFRNILVIVQFAISIVLIIGCGVVYSQLSFMQSKNPGFAKENVIFLNNTWNLKSDGKVFKNELAQHPEFVSSSFSGQLPPNITSGNAFRKGGTEQDYLLRVCRVDWDHLKTMGYKMAQGRFFSPEFPSDTTAIILNETAFKLMGFDKVENQIVINYGSGKPQPLRLVGVMKDFNYESFRNPIKPLALVLGPEPNDVMAIRITAGDPSKAVSLLETIWKKYRSSSFTYTFIDQDFDALVRSEKRMGQLIVIFTVLTIFIACLGLFGLSIYVGEQRAKEIGIRKVMGASSLQVMLLLFRNFALLIVVSFAVAAPIAWILTDRWLQGFTFRVGISPVIVALSGITALGIAILTISYQSVRAARENPIRVLKQE